MNGAISTRHSWPVQPCASFEVPTSLLTMFGLPATQTGSGSTGQHDRGVPCARRQLNHAAPNIVGQAGHGEERATVVEHLDE